MASALRLEVDTGAEPCAEFCLAGEDAIVGRDPSSDIVIDDLAVSGRHGILRSGPGGYTYTDLASRNGSALACPGCGARRLASGEAIPVAPGDVLLLGSADRPVRVRIETGVGAFAAGPSPERTVVAASPIVDLLAAGPSGLVSLAARAIAAASADDLADAALAWLRSTLPRAAGWSVRVVGAGFSAAAGDALPDGLRKVAIGHPEAVLLSQGAPSLPATASIASTGMTAAIVAPLLAGGCWHGALAAWSPAGSAALPPATLEPLAVASSLVALSAAALAVRREGEEARRLLEVEVRRLKGEAGGAAAADGPIGTSPGFVRTVALCRDVAPSDVPVVLVGETGTGKEVLARAIHRWSRRVDRPFVAFNCAAVPENLLESELFGHVRGAFTGAGTDRRGLFEEAHTGTIFLDEIGEMPLQLQAKLLRVLQDGEVRRVGANRTTRVDVRVLSATNRDLARQVETGAFRSDVLYRLNAVTARIPPLRERPDDIPLLAHHLLGLACRRAGKRVAGFSPEALACLDAYAFPGNVRELENEVLRAVALTREGEAIAPAAFSEALARRAADGPASGSCGEPGTGRTLHAVVEAAERQAIDEALGRVDGNVSQAARELGLTRPGLYKVMERLGMRG